MQSLANRESWVPKSVILLGAFACFWNIVFPPFFMKYSLPHFIIFFIYLFLSIGNTLYCIHKHLHDWLALIFMHWIGVLLLTLPPLLSYAGILPMESASKSYMLLLWFFDGAMFGLRSYLTDGLAYLAVVLFAIVQIVLITLGAYKLQK